MSILGTLMTRIEQRATRLTGSNDKQRKSLNSGSFRCSMTLENYYIQLRDNLLDQWSGPNSVR